MEAPVALKLGFVNAFLLEAERCVLVDTGYPGSEARIESLMRQAGLNPARVSLIVITHAHLDHYGSAAALRHRWKVPVACGRDDAGDMASGVNRHLSPIGFSGRIASFAAKAAAGKRAAAFVPDILFSGPSSLEEWGVDASVMPCPGHTPGSLAVVPGAGTASFLAAGRDLDVPWSIVGDLAFGRFTAPRRARLPIFAGDRAALAASLRLFSGSRVAFVGHGGPLEGSGFSPLAERLDRSDPS